MIAWLVGCVAAAAGLVWARRFFRREPRLTAPGVRLLGPPRPSLVGRVWVVRDDSGWADLAEVCVGPGAGWREADGRDVLALHVATLARRHEEVRDIVVAIEEPTTVPDAEHRARLTLLSLMDLPGREQQPPSRLELPPDAAWGRGRCVVVHRGSRVLAGAPNDVRGEVDSVLPPTLASATISTFEGDAAAGANVRALRIRDPSGRTWWYAGRVVSAESFGTTDS